MTEIDFESAVADARRRYEAGGDTALDILLRAYPNAADSVAEGLRHLAGVAVIRSPGEGQPSFHELDADFCRRWRCALVESSDGSTLLAAENPWDEALLQKTSRRLGHPVSPAAVTRVVLDGWLATASSSRTTGRESVPATQVDQARVDGPIVDFVDLAISAGFERGASDIHFECDRTGVSAKHRLDGVMTPFARLAGVEQAQQAISRIKVLAQLDITERRLPQDGRFRSQVRDQAIDLRVSIMPSVFGEDAVLRLLDKAQLRDQRAEVSLDLLGFDKTQARLIRELAREPSGMLLVTGPTGSGKTTTVYAALAEINDGREKIITIEDPVEYELAGVLQIPVNERKGLTFAKGLRSILRHDPDRILVGEIRDAETAEIAVQSALTGHVVFTTVHANNVADIIGRFRHFGLDMFGFMSSLNGVVVQRLLRRVCPRCIGWRQATDQELNWLSGHGQAASRGVPAPQGCAHCHSTGFHGRFVASEVHLVDDAFRDDVTAGAPLSTLRRHAKDAGVETLSAQAARRVVEGVTTIEEVKRVVGWIR